MVVFRYNQPSWAVGRYAPDGAEFIKTIGAVSGEILKLRHNGRTVLACQPGGSCQVLGTALTRDSHGRPLPLPPFEDGEVIPSGMVYVRSNRVPNSYDSRYIGLVPARDIRGTVTAFL